MALAIVSDDSHTQAALSSVARVIRIHLLPQGATMRHVLALLVVSLLGFCISLQPALADKRVALVIGNSAYQNVPKLTNPANDAAAIAALLRDAKFEVVEFRRDLGNVEMRRMLREFAGKARDADIAVVFYAGHGIEAEGTDYLVPVDALLERDSDAYDEAIALDRVLQAIEPAKRLRLVILDACRDNPFVRTMQRTMASRSIVRGLAGVEPSKPNTLVAFAAKGGSTAEDGDNAHSPFTTALLQHLTTPGVDLRKALGQVRDDVMRATEDRQEPFVYGSLGGGDVYLVPPPPRVQALEPQADPRSEVRRDYELALQVATSDGWRSFLKQYPTGFYADLAKSQLAKLAAEDVRVAATDKAKAAAEEKSRLEQQKADVAAQTKAAADAKAADDARVAAEQAKQAEVQRAAETERLRAAAERAAADRAAREQAEADAKAIRDKAQAEAKAIRDKAEADAAKAEQARKAAEQEAERLRLAALEQAKSAQPPVASSLTEKPQIATLTPNDSNAVSKEDAARSLQTELQRVGCFSGKLDGDWTAPSQHALDQFNKYAGTKLDIKLASADALDSVKSRQTRVCPLICDHGFRANHDRCEKIVCHGGYFIGDDNTCQKRTAVKRDANPIAKPRESSSASTGEQQIYCGPGGGNQASMPCRPVAKGCRLVSFSNGYGGQKEVCN
jgi:Caspase domain